MTRIGLTVVALIATAGFVATGDPMLQGAALAWAGAVFADLVADAVVGPAEDET